MRKKQRCFDRLGYIFMMGLALLSFCRSSSEDWTRPWVSPAATWRESTVRATWSLWRSAHACTGSSSRSVWVLFIVVMQSVNVHKFSSFSQIIGHTHFGFSRHSLCFGEPSRIISIRNALNNWDILDPISVPRGSRFERFPRWIAFQCDTRNFVQLRRMSFI